MACLTGGTDLCLSSSGRAIDMEQNLMAWRADAERHMSELNQRVIGKLKM